MSLETKVFTSSREVPVSFARIEPKLVFLEKFHWKSPIWNFTEIRPVRSHVDTCGQTGGRTERG